MTAAVEARNMTNLARTSHSVHRSGVYTAQTVPKQRPSYGRRSEAQRPKGDRT